MRLSALALSIVVLGLLVSAGGARTPVGTVISNQATVSFTDHGGQSLVSHSDIARLTVAAGVRLAVTVDALPNPVAPGDSLTVDVIIENPGNTAAQEVLLTMVTDVVGSVAAFADSAAIVEGRQISWPAVEITPGSRVLRRFRVHIDSTAQHGSDFGLEATVIAANVDEPLLLTRRVNIDFAPRLVLTKDADRDSVTAGGVVEYSVHCVNTGNATARGVRVRDDVASALTPSSSSRPFTKAGSVLTWDVGDLEAGAVVSFQLLVRVSDGVVTGSSLLNQVSATAMATGPDGAPRSFVSESPTVTVTVIDPALSLAKMVQSELPVPGRGDVIAYRLELTNAAAIAAGSVVLRDTLPEPLRFVSAEAEVPVSVREQIVEATWPEVVAGSTVFLSILARVDSVDTLPELITNRAWAESSISVIPSNAVETTLRLDEPTDGELEQPSRIFAGADLTIEVRDADANHHPTVIDTVTVGVTNQRSGEVETLLLPETGVDTGVFTGAVGTAHSQERGEDNDGHLFAVPADQLVSTYSDLLTATGEPAQRLAQTEVALTSIALRVYPDAIVANGTERAIFTATLTDDEGLPLPDGTPVVWRTDAGVFTEVSVDDDGQAMTKTVGGGGEARVALTGPQLTRRDTLIVIASLAGFDSNPLALQLLPGAIGVRVFDDERGIEVTAADPDLEVTVRVSGSTSAGASLSEDIDLDDNGVFVVDQLPPGDYSLDVTVEDAATGRLVFAGLLQQISVNDDGTATPPKNSVSGSLRGRSESSGGRYAGSIVELLDRATGAVVDEGVADTDGGYQFHNLNPGAYDLRVVFDDGTVVTRPVPEPSEVIGTALVNTDILIDPFGIVFDASSGEAVPGVEVSLRMADDTVVPLPGLNGTGAVPNDDNVNPFTTGVDGRYAFLFGGNQVGAFGRPQMYTMAVNPDEGSSFLPRRLLLSVQPSRAGPVESTPITMRVSAADGLPLAVPNSFALTTDDVVLADIETIALHLPLFARAAVLEFAKIALSDTVAPGESVDFGLAIANTGNDTARAVLLTDSLGVGWEIEWTDRGTLAATDVVRWELGDIAPGRRDTLGLRARVIAPQAHGTVLTNRAHLSVTEGFPLRAETAVVVHSTPLWILSKQALADSVTSSQDVEYLLEYRNDGTGVARGGSLVDTLAAGLSVVAAEGAQIDGNVVRWSLEDVAVGATGSRRLVARVDADLVPGSLVSNRAVVLAPDGSVAAADSASVITRAPRMNLVKRALVDTVTQGDRATFTITVTNEGETPVTSVTLVDSLPLELSIVDAADAVVPDAVAVEPGAVTWQLDSLAAGAADTFRVTVETEEAALVTNQARLLIASQTIATATATIAVRERPPLEVGLVADAPTLEAGAVITYTAHLRAPSSIAGQVVVTDSLPAALVYQTSLDGPQPEYDSDSNVLTWTIADLGPEGPLTLIFTAAVSEGLPPGESVVQNRVVAQLGAQQFVSERVETLVTVPFLRIEKSADVTVVEVGDFVEYRIQLQNTSAGTDTLRNILINDWTPPGFRYAESTAVLDGVPQQPSQPGSGLLLWSVPPLAGNDVSELIYRLVVGLDAPFGDGDNTVRVTAQTARGADQDAGPVSARVRVRPDLFSRGELILGRAWIDADGDGLFDYDEEVVPGIALLMEDGTRIIADRHGKFSVPEVRPGDHVLRVLKHNLTGLEPTALGSRSAGDPWSRFVTVPVAGSAKANFPFRRPDESQTVQEP